MGFEVTLQLVWAWLAETASSVWNWLIGANSFWSTLFATSVGAYVAFELERRRRNRERNRRECAIANSVIATLGRMLVVLENFDEALPRPKDRKHANDNFDPIDGIPANMPSIKFEDLVFLLETNNPGDQCAFVYGRIAHAQAAFDTALSQIHERNRLAHEYQQESLKLHRGESGLESKLAKGNLHNRLLAANAELDIGLPKRVELFKEVIDQLRSALASRYPGRQFLGLTVKDK